MKVSTRGRYAVRAIMYLAEKYGQGPVPLNIISKNQDISVKYLENIMRTLINSGIVASVKGKTGGYILAKPPEQVRVSEILQNTEGSLSPVACLDNCSVCKRSGLCAAQDMWEGLGKVINEYLDSATIERLAKAQKIKFAKAGIKQSRS
jgi:Rrf2 family protein